MCTQLPFGTFRSFHIEITSLRINEQAVDPSQPAKTNTKSPFVSHTPKTLVATLQEIRVLPMPACINSGSKRYRQKMSRKTYTRQKECRQKCVRDTFPKCERYNIGTSFHPCFYCQRTKTSEKFHTRRHNRTSEVGYRRHHVDVGRRLLSTLH